MGDQGVEEDHVIMPFHAPAEVELEACLDGDDGAACQFRKKSRPSTVLWAEMAPSGQASWQQ